MTTRNRQDSAPDQQRTSGRRETAAGFAGFECTACGHEARVAGCADYGTEVRTRTIHCTDCGCLHDMVEWERPIETGRGPSDLQWIEMEPSCPADLGHRWEYWEFPGPCPRCGAPMRGRSRT